MNSAKEKIGLFGGSFNPIHNRHIEIAQKAMEQFGLNRLIFVPTAHPPHKQLNAVSDEERLEMVELAVAGQKGFEVSTVEMNRAGTSYTIDTLHWFKDQYPKAELFFLIGEDTLTQLFTWKRAEEVVALCHFLVAPRVGVGPYSPGELAKAGVRFSFVTMDGNDVSSSEIREKMVTEINGLTLPVPSQVTGYIQLQGLYGLLPLLGEAGYYDKLKTCLGTYRRAHSLSVMITCITLAQSHGLSLQKAALAGLLHDCGKELSIEQMQKLLEGETFSPRVWKSSALLHSFAGAKLAQVAFNVKDEEVLGAIATHTLGKVPMTDLEMVVFLADGIEPMRRQRAETEKTRELAVSNLKQALAFNLNVAIKDLKARGKEIEPTAYKVLEWSRKEESV